MNEYIVTRKWKVKAKNTAEAVSAAVPGEHYFVESTKVSKVKKIKELAKDYADAAVSNSWAGSGHPSEYELKRQAMIDARAKLFEAIDEALK